MQNPTENADLTALNTLGIPATADYLVRITDADQLKAAAEFAESKNLPIFPLGGGSNIVLRSDRLRCVAVKIEIPGREVLESDEHHTVVKVGGGENWDAFVAWSVEQGLRGIESLSLIPGTVGAAPVQNIGAYGQELNETVVEVETYDLQEKKPVTFANADCRFSYRDSIFKHEGKGRYVVTSVTFKLVPATDAPAPTYASLQAELDRRGISNPTVADIRDAVIAIRRGKLPDPAVTPTAGSFFHNPIVKADELQQIQTQNPDVPAWPYQDKFKLSAAWLIDQCGFKGQVQNGVGMYDKQALALINPGHKSAAEVLAFADKVASAVHDRFGVNLRIEPELISY